MNTPKQQAAFLAAAKAALPHIRKADPLADEWRRLTQAVEAKNYDATAGVVVINATRLQLINRLRLFPDGVWECGNGLIAIQRGKRHRVGAPAVERRYADGYEVTEYRLHDNLHREGAPARVFRYADGSTIVEWWLNGVQVDPFFTPAP